MCMSFSAWVFCYITLLSLFSMDMFRKIPHLKNMCEYFMTIRQRGRTVTNGAARYGLFHNTYIKKSME